MVRSSGVLFFWAAVSVFGALTQFERCLIAERTHDGMNAARAKGSRPGRPPLNPEKLAAALFLVKGGIRPPNRAQTLNPLPRNLSAGSCLSP
jgi:DNA invertase Pin-like site-specific DNA recombinase